MSISQLESELNNKNIKVLFTDYYDTLVHRTVHPNYTLKIWAKHMIRELGLIISIDELYFIRQESQIYLTGKLNKNSLEIPYETLKKEICNRLINNNILDLTKKECFMNLFEKADFRSESDVQYLNQNVLKIIKKFKKNGGKIYLVSDFYGSTSLFQQMLKHHNVIDYFDDIFSSASLGKSKHTGTIYKDILEKLCLKANEVMMIGDNKISDLDHAIKNGLNSFLLPHNKYLRKNKIKNLGNDKKLLKKTLNNIYKNCNKKEASPYTEYIIFYHFFAEELYKKCKKENINTLFFLAREGLFLKKIFDTYQEHKSLDNKLKINSHYLKISRQASLQLSLKPLENEGFEYLKKNYPSLSIKDFLTTLNCPKEIIKEIFLELNINNNNHIENFFNSDIFKKLKLNNTFQSFYTNHRLKSKKAFNNYINSFNVNINQEGITVIDIGWGGTMQESIYAFFDKKTPVTGYYLGLKHIYNIHEKTKRFGLLFSVQPYTSYNDHILMANTQFYEQFSASNHGSTIGYTNESSEYAITYYEPNEKSLFNNHIKKHQEEMFKHHKLLLKKLDNICYSEDNLKWAMSIFALKIGLFQHSRKLKFIKLLNIGFYQNVGSNEIGISYKAPKTKSLIKDTVNFILTPEKHFRYLVKIKPMIYEKSKILAFFFPSTLLYLYFNFNKFLRFKLLNKIILLKFNIFK